MKVWRQADVEARPGDIFDAALEGAAQEVHLLKGGAVVVPLREWLRLKAMEERVAKGETEPTLHEWLFAPGPTFDEEFDQSFLPDEPANWREPPDLSDA